MACSAWEPLPIKLFNDAEASSLVVSQAKTEAAWLLKAAYFEIHWIPCQVITVSNLLTCEGPALAIEFHILASTSSSDLTKNSMGIAFPNSAASRAAVFLSRVRQLVAANAGIIDEGGLLGHVMAHEIGHLLLHSTNHSNEGLMRAEFNQGDLRKAAQRQLKFTNDQIQAIRRNFIARSN